MEEIVSKIKKISDIAAERQIPIVCAVAFSDRTLMLLEGTEQTSKALILHLAEATSKLEWKTTCNPRNN